MRLSRLLILACLLMAGAAPGYSQSVVPAPEPQPAPAMRQKSSSAAPPERVSFPSLDGATTLTAWLSRPAASDPRPAVVMLHGCSGLLNPQGRMIGTYRVWMRLLQARGFVVLAVDSATPRGFGETCSGGPARRVMFLNRPKDAYGALRWLQSQPFVRPDRIAVAGWSQGGGVALLSIGDRSFGRPADIAADFAAAVLFYPGICADKFMSKPFTAVEPNSWTTKVPMLALLGEADVWALPGPCIDFLEGARARGSAVEVKTYPNATHAFDAPNLTRIELPQYREGAGAVPVMETDGAARADALRRVPAFLEAQLNRRE